MLFCDTLDTAFRFSSTTIESNGKSLAHRRDWVCHTGKMDLHVNSAAETVTATIELPALKQQDVNVEAHGTRLSIFWGFKCSENHGKGRYTAEDSHAKM
ncbi:hypothetical protein F4604DRAFT_1932775 [Suillus subluteus]|nr:hypothetical protein F4604DRAFT_1932775 [Suillus subluteus]